MEYVTVEEMRNLDKYAIENIGIPSIVLMENAAIRVFDEIKNEISQIKEKKILVVCGKGNNGGDGLALTRHLQNNNAIVNVILLTNKEELKGDAKINLNIVERMKVNVFEIRNEEMLISNNSILSEADIIVDAIFGTGFQGKLDGLYALAVKLINDATAKKVAIDIPSGLNADSGVVEGDAVRADLTITLGRAKLGYKHAEANEYLGKLKVVDISLPIIE